MNAIEIVEGLRNHNKGAHVQVAWRRDCKTRKDCQHRIEKQTIAWVRAGISYANLTAVKDGISSGERDEVQELPWGQWRAGYANYIIDHELKDGVSREYVRLYPATFENLSHPQVTYFVDGKPMEYQAIEAFLLASEKPKPDEEKPLCFCVQAESIKWVE
jgi:hypothetical protein